MKEVSGEWVGRHKDKEAFFIVGGGKRPRSML